MQYWIIENGQKAGPFEIDQLREKKISAETYVWTEGMPDWAPAWQVGDLKSIITEKPDQGATPPPYIPPIPDHIAQQNNGQQNMNPGMNQNAGMNNGMNQQGMYQGAGMNNGMNNGMGQQAGYNGMGQNPYGQQQPTAEPEKKKTWMYAGIVAFLLLFIMGCSNPSEEDHEKEINSVLTEAMSKVSDNEESGNDIFIQGFAMIGKMFANHILGSAIDNLFEYHNYLLFSTGSITLNDDSHTVSYGFLGHVYTVNSDDVVKALSNGAFSFGNNKKKKNDDDDSEEQKVISSDGNNEDDNEESTSLEDKANQAADKIVDRVSDKVSEKVNKKIDQMTDSSTVDRVIDKVIGMFN